MPFVLFAHQAPFLPIARRWPERVDGLTFLLGTMSPDFAYALTGMPLAVWAHEFPGLATFCVPVTLCVSWLVARVLAPVVPAHLPDLGRFHLHDYRALAAHRFGWLRAPLWALLGACSHAALDELGHGWGWPAQHWEAYRSVVLDGTFLGRPWTPFRLVQYAGHLLLTPLGVWLLWRYGAQRWLAAAAAGVPEFAVSSRSRAVLWSATTLGTALGLGWATLGGGDSSARLLRTLGGIFAGLVVGAWLARRTLARRVV